MQNSRRPARPQDKKLAEEILECSTKSIVTAINRFIKSVNNMNDTVLLPSKLQDMEMTTASSAAESTDLFSLAVLLNKMKEEMLMGKLDEDQTTTFDTLQNKKYFSSSIKEKEREKEKEKEKEKLTNENDDGFSSLNSYSRSSSDDDSSDTDSEFYRRENSVKCSSDTEGTPQCLTNIFRHHLQGLHTTLQRFSEYADQVSSSYQDENGSEK